MKFTLPEPNDILNVTMDDGAVIRVRRHGKPDGPRLALAHGNGFASDAYYPFWRHFLEDYDLIVYDQRNHGWNPYWGAQGHSLDGFSRDMQTLKRATGKAFGAKKAVGLFHSISSLTALLNLAEFGMSWEGLVLFDPPFIPARDHDLHELCFGFELFLANWAMGRPDTFDSPADLAAGFKKARGLALWVEGAHELMAEAVTRQDEASGKFRLVCARELEASAYINNAFSRVWLRLPAVAEHREKLLFIASDPKLEGQKSPAFINEAAARQFGWRHIAVENTTHLLQIERPDHIAGLVKEFLDGVDFD